MMRTAIIGGSGVYDLNILVDPKERVIDTEYGAAKVKIGLYEDMEIVFLSRHGEGHTLPPHKINYRANIAALKNLGVERIIGTTAVGSINADFKPGDFVLLDQFIDFTKNRIHTFYDGAAVHVDMTNPYCPEIRKSVIDAAKALKIDLHEKGMYVCTEGPRFETGAEIQMFALLGGDVVGMTNIPECVLAREVEICYSAIALVTNQAAGISGGELSHSQMIDEMKSKQEGVKALIMNAATLIPGGRKCLCKDALRGAHIGELLTK
ncbi:MAG: S-methyl-5'-thioadenosine phosphorylase [Methanocellales archaeon]|nr:S-methyl-5'-thioadenosine phosphorylase [Methanocellales archaeon]